MQRPVAPPEEPRSRPERVVLLWPLVRDVLAFALGSFILAWETIVRQSSDPVLVAAGLAILGIPLTGVVRKALDGTNGK